MSYLRYVTHPDVIIDPDVPVPRWGLSAEGVKQTRATLRQPWLSATGRVVSSAETKALEAAGIIAGHLGLTVETRAATGENDRTSTGFVPPSEFERLADAFFSRPHESVQGWERAIDAQARIVAALTDLLEPAPTDIVVVGHGGVGTLWYCHLTDQPIDRRHDQPGAGHYFTVDLDTGRVVHPWRPVDEIESS